jgi:hypothetical protein
MVDKKNDIEFVSKVNYLIGYNPNMTISENIIKTNKNLIIEGLGISLVYELLGSTKSLSKTNPLKKNALSILNDGLSVTKQIYSKFTIKNASGQILNEAESILNALVKEQLPKKELNKLNIILVNSGKISSDFKNRLIQSFSKNESLKKQIGGLTESEATNFLNTKKLFSKDVSEQLAKKMYPETKNLPKINDSSTGKKVSSKKNEVFSSALKGIGDYWESPSLIKAITGIGDNLGEKRLKVLGRYLISGQTSSLRKGFKEFFYLLSAIVKGDLTSKEFVNVLVYRISKIGTQIVMRWIVLNIVGSLIELLANYIYKRTHNQEIKIPDNEILAAFQKTPEYYHWDMKMKYVFPPAIWGPPVLRTFNSLRYGVTTKTLLERLFDLKTENKNEINKIEQKDKDLFLRIEDWISGDKKFEKEKPKQNSVTPNQSTDSWGDAR